MSRYLTICCCLLLSCNQHLKTGQVKDRPLLYQHWIHSFEEDHTENNTNPINKTYRPATYSFPLARGREGFEIKPNGTWIAHSIAPGDGNLSIEEKWKLNNDTLIIAGRKGLSAFKIKSLSKEKLVLELLPAN